MDATALQLIIPIAGIAAVLFALWLARDVLSRDKGPQAMQDVADTIREGADAFIKRQYTTIGIYAVVGMFVIGAVITLFETKDVADTSIFGLDLGLLLGGAVLTEKAFSLNGLGKYAYDGIIANDLPKIMGVTLLAGFFIVLANLIVDLMYAVVDPRVRIG